MTARTITPIHQLPSDIVTDLAFSNDSTTLVVASYAIGKDDSRGGQGSDRAVLTLWNTRTWRPVRTIAWKVPSENYHSLTVATASTRPWLACTNAAGKPELRSTHTLDRIVSLEDPGQGRIIAYLAFSPGGELLAGQSEDGYLHLWDTMRGKLAHTFPHPQAAEQNAPEFGAFGVEFLNDRTWVTGWNRWNITESHKPTLMYGRGPNAIRPSTVKYAHISVRPFPLPLCLNCMAVSPDGNMLATGSENAPCICLLDAASGRLINRIRERGKIYRVGFLRDGHHLIAVGDEWASRLYDTRSGQKIAEFSGLQEPNYACAISPDGKTLAIGGKEKKISIYRLDVL